MTSLPKPLVRLRGVTKTYRRGGTPVHALRDVSLAIPEGAFVGVVGPSGSGKSTLLHLLAALDQPSAGTIRVGDWALGALDDAARARYRRSMVGLVFQEFHLVPTMTAQENVALPLLLAGVPPGERRPQARRTLETVGLGDRTDHRPAELSGGEQQRVATARALVGDPPLLLADEPTGNLDAETGARIIDLLARLRREDDRTVVVVTHHVEEIEHVTEQRVRLRDGARADEG
jgi:predicted ABC-type transport system involved in lysophospholipase L1 biosynthesis ATPase subunit